MLSSTERLLLRLPVLRSFSRSSFSSMLLLCLRLSPGNRFYCDTCLAVQETKAKTLAGFECRYSLHGTAVRMRGIGIAACQAV